MSLERLKTLLPPPDSPRGIPKSPDWTEVESVVGTLLPSDYRAFIEEYGSGGLGNLLVFVNPFPSSEDSTSPSQLGFEYCLMMAQRLWEDFEDFPYPPHPEKPGLLPFGTSSNGGLLCWLTSGEPDDWPVVVADWSSEVETEGFDGTFTEFLTAVLERRFHSR